MVVVCVNLENGSGIGNSRAIKNKPSMIFLVVLFPSVICMTLFYQRNNLYHKIRKHRHSKGLKNVYLTKVPKSVSLRPLCSIILQRKVHVNFVLTETETTRPRVRREMSKFDSHNWKLMAKHLRKNLGNSNPPRTLLLLSRAENISLLCENLLKQQTENFTVHNRTIKKVKANIKLLGFLLTIVG